MKKNYNSFLAEVTVRALLGQIAKKTGLQKYLRDGYRLNSRYFKLSNIPHIDLTIVLVFIAGFCNKCEDKSEFKKMWNEWGDWVYKSLYDHDDRLLN